MAFMNAVGVVKSEHPAIIRVKQMRQQKCQVLANNLLIRIHPNFFSQNTYATGAPKAGFVVGILT